MTSHQSLRTLTFVALVCTSLFFVLSETCGEERKIQSLAERVLGSSGPTAGHGGQNGTEGGGSVGSGVGDGLGSGSNVGSGSGGGSGEPTRVDPFPCPAPAPCETLGCKEECISHVLGNGCLINVCRDSVVDGGDDKKPECPPEWACTPEMVKACKDVGQGCKNFVDGTTSCEYGKCEACPPRNGCKGWVNGRLTWLCGVDEKCEGMRDKSGCVKDQCVRQGAIS